MSDPFPPLPSGPAPSTPASSVQSRPDGRPTFAEIAAGRRQVASLLSDTFNELPSTEQLRRLRDNPVLDAAVVGDADGEAAVTALRGAIHGVERDASIAFAISVDRTRLLRGIRPGQGLPPACESVYRSDIDAHVGAKAGEPATGRFWAALHERYGRAEFAPNRDLPSDFIGNELGFFAFLIAGETRAWEKGERRSALARAREQLAFLDDHIVRWIGALVDRVRGEAASGFWPALLALTEAHLRQERDYLRDLLAAAADPRETAVSSPSS